MLSCLHSVFICSHLFHGKICILLRSAVALSSSPHPSVCRFTAQRHTCTPTRTDAFKQCEWCNAVDYPSIRQIIGCNSIQGLRSDFNHAICMAGVNLHICQKCYKCFPLSPPPSPPSLPPCCHAIFRYLTFSAVGYDRPEFDPEA